MVQLKFSVLYHKKMNDKNDEKTNDDKNDSKVIFVDINKQISECSKAGIYINNTWGNNFIKINESKIYRLNMAVLILTLNYQQDNNYLNSQEYINICKYLARGIDNNDINSPTFQNKIMVQVESYIEIIRRINSENNEILSQISYL